MPSRPIPKQSAVYDHRRNTSAVHGVSPNAMYEALEALETWRARNPAHAAWIEAGAPPLTEDEHRRRFGGPYEVTRTRKGKP